MWSSLPVALVSSIGQYLSVSEFCLLVRPLCTAWRHARTSQQRLTLFLDNSPVRYFCVVNPGTVQQLVLVGAGRQLGQTLRLVETRAFRLADIEYQAQSASDDSKRCSYALGSVLSRLASRIKTLRLPDETICSDLIGVKPHLCFSQLQDLETLHVVFPRSRYHAQELIRSMTQLRLKELRVLAKGAVQGLKLADVSEECIHDLTTIIEGLDVFDGQQLFADARLLARLKDCKASWMGLTTEARELADFVLQNSAVRSMSLSIIGLWPCTPELFAAVQTNTQTEFALFVKGRAAEARGPEDSQGCTKFLATSDGYGYGRRDVLEDFISVAASLSHVQQFTICGKDVFTEGILPRGAAWPFCAGCVSACLRGWPNAHW